MTNCTKRRHSYIHPLINNQPLTAGTPPALSITMETTQITITTTISRGHNGLLGRGPARTDVVLAGQYDAVLGDDLVTLSQDGEYKHTVHLDKLDPKTQQRLKDHKAIHRYSLAEWHEYLRSL